MLKSCFDHNNFPNIENRERKVLYSIDWGMIKFHNGKWQQMMFVHQNTLRFLVSPSQMHEV